MDFGLALELDAALLQGAVLPHTVVGFDAEQRHAGGLAPNERFLLIGFRNIEVDAELFVVRQAHQQPAVTAHLAVFSDYEAQLFGIELERLVLIPDEQLDQCHSFHEYPLLTLILQTRCWERPPAAMPSACWCLRVWVSLTAGCVSRWAPLFTRRCAASLRPSASELFIVGPMCACRAVQSRNQARTAGRAPVDADVVGGR